MDRQAVAAKGLVAGQSHLVPRSRGSEVHVRRMQLRGAAPRHAVKHQQPYDHVGADTEKSDEHSSGPTDEVTLPAAPFAVVREVGCLQISDGCKRHRMN